MVKKVVCLIGLLGMLSSAWGLMEITAEDVRSGAIWKLTPEVVKKKDVRSSNMYAFPYGHLLATVSWPSDGKNQPNRNWRTSWLWTQLDTPEWYNEIQNWIRYWDPPSDATAEQVREWGKNLQTMRPRAFSRALYSEVLKIEDIKDRKSFDAKIRKMDAEVRKQFQSHVNKWSEVLGVAGKKSTEETASKYKYYRWIGEGESAVVCIVARRYSYTKKDEDSSSSESSTTSGYAKYTIILALAPNMKVLNRVIGKERQEPKHPWELSGEHTYDSMVWDGSIWKISPDALRGLSQMSWKMWREDGSWFYTSSKGGLVPQREGRSNVLVQWQTLFGDAGLGHTLFYWSPEHGAWPELWKEVRKKELDPRAENIRIKRISSLLFKELPKAEAKQRVDDMVKHINKFCRVEGEKKTTKKGKRTDVICTWQFKGSVARLEAMYEDKESTGYAVLTFAPDAENLDFQRDKTDISKTMQAIVDDADANR